MTTEETLREQFYKEVLARAADLIVDKPGEDDSIEDDLAWNSGVLGLARAIVSNKTDEFDLVEFVVRQMKAGTVPEEFSQPKTRRRPVAGLQEINDSPLGRCRNLLGPHPVGIHRVEDKNFKACIGWEPMH